MKVKLSFGAQIWFVIYFDALPLRLKWDYLMEIILSFTRSVLVDYIL